MLQYKVPQNIKMPDQIIGPLTLEQFLYLLFASAIIYMVYLYFGYGNLFYALSIPVALVAIAFAFVPVNEQPFSKFIANLLLFLASPKVMLWQQQPPPVFELSSQTSKADKAKEKEAIRHPGEVKSQLQQLSLILDTQIEPEKDVRQKMTEHEQDKPATRPQPNVKKATVLSTPTAAVPEIKIPTPKDTTTGNGIGNIIGGLFKRQKPATTDTTTMLKEMGDAKKAAIEEILNKQKQI
ncbi:MAG: PrgI family protein [Patescibacteria group bacterium]